MFENILHHPPRYHRPEAAVYTFGGNQAHSYSGAQTFLENNLCEIYSVYVIIGRI